jgi:hypothetical protein
MCKSVEVCSYQIDVFVKVNIKCQTTWLASVPKYRQQSCTLVHQSNHSFITNTSNETETVTFFSGRKYPFTRRVRHGAGDTNSTQIFG